MKKRTIKKIIFFIILFLIIGLFLYLKFKIYTYDINYVLNAFKINESYNKKDLSYTFIIKYDGISYPYKIKNDYIRKKELIKEIKIYNNEKEKCILPISDYIKFYPICNKEQLTMYNSSNINIKDFKYKKIKDNNIKHEKLLINFLNNNYYLLYNYKGFYYIKDKEVNNIELFNKDVYTMNLVYELNEFIIIPDYNEDHYFNKIYVINKENGKTKEIKFKYDISFNSIFLGDYKNNIYLLDKKEKKQYKINIKKLEIKECEFLILKNNVLEKTTYNNIVNNNLLFDNKLKLNYKIIDNKLYQIIDNYKILITEKDVDKIIKESNNTIYYLVDDKLYMYNNVYGEIFLLSNFEWNFNNTNMIFLNK